MNFGVFQCRLTLLNIKYNSAVFFSQMYWLFMYDFRYIFLETSTVKLQSEILLPAVFNVLDTADFGVGVSR